VIETLIVATMVCASPATAVAEHGADVARNWRDRDVASPQLGESAHVSFALQLPQEPAKPPFGTKNSWRWQLQAGGALQADNPDNRFALLGGGVSYFPISDLSLDLELNGMYISQEGDDALAGNLNMLMRWHFHHDRERRWSLYLDGGIGLFQATDDVPAFKGSHFNFTPQLGGGVSWQVAEDVRMMAGLRWHHISNANLFDVNDGRDSAFVYVGVSVPF
jgi:opacity protein-like surface antigen